MMDINIHTTLDVAPIPGRRGPEYLYMVRGATASLSYSLANKDYCRDFRQIMFIFKQNGEIWAYSFILYLRKTEDEEAVEGKVYYKNLVVVEGGDGEVEATPVTDYDGNPSAAGYYEIFEPADDQTDLYWMRNSHFSALGDEITFTFSSDETKALPPTTPETPIVWEVMLKVDSDLRDDLGKHDSVFIEPQKPIALFDSLYGQADSLGANSSLTAGTSLSRLSSSSKSVRE